MDEKTLHAILHPIGSEALKVELTIPPQPTHAFISCRNVRLHSGEGRPTGLENPNSTFLFPWEHIRYVEILPEANDEDLLLPYRPSHAGR